MISQYSCASNRFKNIAEFTVITHKVEDAVIAAVTRAVMGIFKHLDKSDEDAKNLIGLLWVFKTILNLVFTSSHPTFSFFVPFFGIVHLHVIFISFMLVCFIKLTCICILFTFYCFFFKKISGG